MNENEREERLHYDRPEEARGLPGITPSGGSRTIVVLGANGRIVWVNPAFTERTGFTLAEVAGRSWKALRPESPAGDLDQNIWKAAREGGVWIGEISYRHKDGNESTLLSTVAPAVDENGELARVVAVGEEATGRETLASSFHQVQKLETVGLLAGWIAHDFNNLLTAIHGYTELLLTDASEGDPAVPDLLAVRAAVERANALTRQLLAFDRQATPRPLELDLNRVVQDLQRILRRLVGEDVRLITRLDEGAALPVLADPGQIEHILLNLVLHSRIAMPAGGTITVETAEAPAGPGRGQTAVLSIRHTGHGFDRDELARVFEPSFPKDEAAPGSGLGLSTVKSIATELGGSVRVDSMPGAATTFHVFLPRANRAHEGPIASETRAASIRPGTVLLVEDDDDVRKITRRILGAKGYDVLEACSGAEALVRSHEHGGNIELLLTDVVMPLMNGPEAAQRIAALRPETRVVFMSGYTGEAVSRHAPLVRAADILQKPFRPDALLARVREALSGR